MKKKPTGKIGIKRAKMSNLRNISMLLYLIMGVLTFFDASYVFTTLNSGSVTAANILGCGVTIVMLIAAYIVLFMKILQTGIALKIEIKRNEIFSLLTTDVLATGAGFIISVASVAGYHAILG